jgi:hypothetical protein
VEFHGATVDHRTVAGEIAACNAMLTEAAALAAAG